MNRRASQDPTERVTLAQLHSFQRVMEEGGYAAAAKVSHLSVPSLWQQIRGLEEAFGVTLFRRRGRQVIPTAAAEKLYTHADSILVQLRSTRSLLSDTPQQATRLVTGVRMTLEDLVEPLAAYREQFAHPLVIRHGNNQRAEELLLADEADVALTLEPELKQSSPRLEYEPAYTVEFLAVAKPDHPFMQTRRRGLRELARHALVVTLPGTHGRDALDQAFHRAGLTAEFAAETDNSAYTIACVQAGMGVGILAGRRRGALCQQLATHSLSRQLGDRQIVFMWRKGRVLDAPCKGLIASVKRFAG